MSSYGYDVAGNWVSTTNPLGAVSSAVYDGANKMIASRRRAGQSALRLSTTRPTTATALVDPLGNRTTSVFDSQSRQIASVDALSNRATFTYNAANRVTAATNALGNTSSLVYDNLQRVIAAIDALGNRYTAGYDLRESW